MKFKKSYDKDKICPNLFYEDDEIMIGEFREWEDYAKSVYNNLISKSKFEYDVYICGQYYNIIVQKKCNKFILTISHHLGFITEIKTENGVIPKSEFQDKELIDFIEQKIENKYRQRQNDNKTEDKPYCPPNCFYNGSDFSLGEFKTLEECNQTPLKKLKLKLDLDIQKEAYDISSELFHFKDLRRGVVEHGKTCYIEGYKKHAELFYTFLVKNGYFSKEELHKVQTDFDAYLNGKPAVSINTCEDLLRKIKTIDFSKHLGGDYKEPENMPVLTPCLNGCQKDIVMHYCDTLTDEKKVLRIKKARQKGVSTILSIIAYLESQNGKKVLYIGGNDPSKKTGLKYNQYFKFLHSIGINDFIGKRYDLIIIDDPRNNKVLEHFHEILPSLSEEGKIIVALTPCSPDFYHYNEIKNFFKRDSASMFTYCTGKSDRADELIEEYPEFRNEMMGEFID